MRRSTPACGGRRFCSARSSLLMILASMLPSIDFDVLEYHLQGPKEYFQAGRISFLAAQCLYEYAVQCRDVAPAGDGGDGRLVVGRALRAASGRAFRPGGGDLDRRGRRRAGVATRGLDRGARVSLDAVDLPAGGDCVRRRAALFLSRGARSGSLVEGRGAHGSEASCGPGDCSGCWPAVRWAASTRDWCRRSFRSGCSLSSTLPAEVASLWWDVMCSAGRSSWRRGSRKNVLDTRNPVYPLAVPDFPQSGMGRRPRGPVAGSARPAAARFRRAQELDGRRRGTGENCSPIHFGWCVNSGARSSTWPAVPTGSRRFTSRWRRWRCCAPARDGWRSALWLFVAYLFLTWWFATHRLDRFWLPMLPALAILAGLGADWIRTRSWSVVLGIVLTIGAVHEPDLHLDGARRA